MRYATVAAVIAVLSVASARAACAQPRSIALPGATTAPTLKGEPGDKGPRGDKGLPGDKGPVGDKGPSSGHTLRVYRVDVTVPPGNFVYKVPCGSNTEYVTGGGFEWKGLGDFRTLRSAPSFNGQVWEVYVVNAAAGPVNLTVHAICLSGL